MNKRYVLISGYGRSGSTIVELFLCQDRSFTGVGELTNLGARVQKNKLCSCGKRFEKCEFWSNLLQGTAKKNQNFTVPSYDQIVKETFHSSHMGVIDSSKTPWKRFYLPFMLRRRFGQNFCVINVFRDPERVLKSCLGGSNERIEDDFPDIHKKWQMLRTLTGYGVANLTGLVSSIFFKVYFLNFDQFIVDSNYRSIVVKDLEFNIANMDGETIERYENTAHLVFGNRVRFQSPLLLNRYTAPTVVLTVYHKLLISICMKPFFKLMKSLDSFKQ